MCLYHKSRKSKLGAHCNKTYKEEDTSEEGKTWWRKKREKYWNIKKNEECSEENVEEEAKSIN